MYRGSRQNFQYLYYIINSSYLLYISQYLTKFVAKYKAIFLPTIELFHLIDFVKVFKMYIK